MFKKDERLSKEEFSSLFHYPKVNRGPLFSVYYKKGDATKVAVMCSRRVGNAVKRNDAKRKIKACVQGLKLQKEAGLLGFLVHKPLNKVASKDINKAVSSQVIALGEHVCKAS